MKIEVDGSIKKFIKNAKSINAKDIVFVGSKIKLLHPGGAVFLQVDVEDHIDEPLNELVSFDTIRLYNAVRSVASKGDVSIHVSPRKGRVIGGDMRIEMQPLADFAADDHDHAMFTEGPDRVIDDMENEVEIDPSTLSDFASAASNMDGGAGEPTIHIRPQPDDIHLEYEGNNSSVEDKIGVDKPLSNHGVTWMDVGQLKPVLDIVSKQDEVTAFIDDDKPLVIESETEYGYVTILVSPMIPE